jgi:hypothetical protein
MLVSRISPAPRSAPSRAQATASRPVAVRPPWTNTSKPCDERRIAHGRAVDRHFVGAGAQQRLGVRHRAHPSPHREREVDRLRHAPHHLDHDRPRVRGRRDVEEDKLVGATGVVADGGLDGIAGVPQRDEAHALHHAAAVDVEAGDEPLREHQALAAAESASRAAASVTRPS